MRTRVLVFASVMSFGVAAPVRAQADPLAYCEGGGVKWGVGPTLLSAPGGDKVGFRATLNSCKTGHIAPTLRVPGAERSGFPRSYMLRFDVNLLVADAALRVPETSSLHVSHGWSWSLSKRPERAPRGMDPDSIPFFDGGGYNRGFLDLGLTGGYESSPEWDEQNLTVGGEARYATNAAGLPRLLPSIVARVDMVKPTTSDARAIESLSNDAHGRWSVRGYWNTSLDFLAAALEPVRLQADLAMYRTFGLEQALVNAGWNQGEYATVSLRYSKRQKLLGPIALTAIYAKYSVGEWPTVLGDRDAFAAGIAVDVGR